MTQYRIDRNIVMDRKANLFRFYTGTFLTFYHVNIFPDYNKKYTDIEFFRNL